MIHTDNPSRDWDRYCEEQDKQLERLPKCSECKEPIQDEKCYAFSGELYCKECLCNYHEKYTEDYVK